MGMIETDGCIDLPCYNEAEPFVSIPVMKCQNGWIDCNLAVPACSKRHLLLVKENGHVVSGSYDAKIKQFKARLRSDLIECFQPKAWRLFPFAPERLFDIDSLIRLEILADGNQNNE